MRSDVRLQRANGREIAHAKVLIAGRLTSSAVSLFDYPWLYHPASRVIEEKLGPFLWRKRGGGRSGKKSLKSGSCDTSGVERWKVSSSERKSIALRMPEGD